MTSRIAALLGKDLMDLRQNPSLFVPALFTAAMALFLPILVAVIIPAATGERLSDSSDFAVALEMYRQQPSARELDPESAIQAWIFQQFLMLLVLAPVAASMSIAAFSVIGEKQARSLEPLLATPITTFELLAAKVLSALLPAVAVSIGTFAIYALLVSLLAGPAVARALFVPQALSVVFLLGPLFAAAALQLAVCASSRVNDARSAQQIGALVILPIAGLLVAQVTGVLVIGVPLILAGALGLIALNALLMRIGIALFDRETILTRWK